MLETELLALPVGDELLMVVNVLEVRGLLDMDLTRWMLDTKGGIAEVPEFVANRISGPSLFKLLPDKHVFLCCWEDDDDPVDSFRHAVRARGLTGLWFEEIWNSEDGGRRPSFPPRA